MPRWSNSVTAYVQEVSRKYGLQPVPLCAIAERIADGARQRSVEQLHVDEAARRLRIHQLREET